MSLVAIQYETLSRAGGAMVHRESYGVSTVYYSGSHVAALMSHLWQPYVAPNKDKHHDNDKYGSHVSRLPVSATVTGCRDSDQKFRIMG